MTNIIQIQQTNKIVVTRLYLNSSHTRYIKIYASDSFFNRTMDACIWESKGHKTLKGYERKIQTNASSHILFEIKIVSKISPTMNIYIARQTSIILGDSTSNQTKSSETFT